MRTADNRVVREFQTKLDGKPEEIFPLLCPVREYDWIQQWQCDMVYSKSGFAELGCVFTTDFGDAYGRETWVVCHYKPNESITFVRTGLRRTTRYEISLTPVESRASILWRQEITGLDKKGEQLVERYTQDAFEKIMQPLNGMLNHYLKTGERLDITLDYAIAQQEE